MFKFYKLLFFSTLIMSTLMAISSYSWFSMWMGLEINLLSIIPLMINNNNLLSSESAIKYFMVQALASSILLMSLIMMNMHTFMYELINDKFLLMFNSALLMKMGAAPFHFWFPEVLEGLNWLNALIILTWQKIAPMLMMIMNSTLFFSIIIIFSMLISGIMGLNQISIRKILAYSSINHISWMIAALMFMKSLWMIYFIVYSIISMNLIILFKKFNIFYLKQIFYSMKSPYLKLFFILNFFSMGGLPPFLGFMPKWLVIQSLISNKFMILTFFMILFTLMTLYFYIRIMFSSLILNMNFLNFYLTKKSNMFIIIIFNTLNLLSLIIITLLFNLN